jgi:hypothetical protein
MKVKHLTREQVASHLQVINSSFWQIYRLGLSMTNSTSLTIHNINLNTW